MVAGGDPRGYYRVLGVDRTASAADIRAAFRERAKLYHPDGGSEPATADGRRFQHLREAYEVLRDPRHRMRYDAESLVDGARDRRARSVPEWPEREDPSAGAGSWSRAAMDRASAAVGRLDPRGVVAAMTVLALALLASLALLGTAWSQLGDRDTDVANRAGGAGPDPVVYRGQLIFPDGATDLDAALERELDGAVSELRRAIGALPVGSRWVVLVEGSTVRAADGTGLLVDAWEQALLRVGVGDRLPGAGTASQPNGSRSGSTPASPRMGRPGEPGDDRAELGLLPGARRRLDQAPGALGVRRRAPARAAIRSSAPRRWVRVAGAESEIRIAWGAAPRPTKNRSAGATSTPVRASARAASRAAPARRQAQPDVQGRRLGLHVEAGQQRRAARRCRSRHLQPLLAAAPRPRRRPCSARANSSAAERRVAERQVALRRGDLADEVGRPVQAKPSRSPGARNFDTLDR